MKDTPTSTSVAADDLRIGIVVSRYHEAVTFALRDGARAEFLDHGGQTANLLVVEAPGAWELVAIARAMIQRGDLDGVLVLGCVITGDTDHDKYICSAVSEGLTTLTVDSGTPIGFGLLTCRNIEQAHARAGGAVGNKGNEAMAATLETIATIRRLQDPSVHLSAGVKESTAS